MKFIFLALLSTIALCSATSLNQHTVASRRSFGETPEIPERPERSDGCNINVCFAIDGSLSMSHEEFESQILFAFDVTSLLVDFPVSYAAVQYSRRIAGISPLTNDVQSFLIALQRARQLRGRGTNIGRGIQACTRRLRRHSEDLNAIFVFTDGRNNRGRNAVRRANRFRHTGGKLFVVGVGSRNDKTILELAGGDSSNVLDIDNFLNTLSATRSLINAFPDTCGNATAAEGEEPSD